MRNLIFIAVAVMGVAGLCWAFWLAPAGAGEYRDSPDGLWRAHVSGLSQGTLLGSRRRYVELSIECLADGSTIWRQQILHTSTETVPDYGDRSARSISWSPDSSQFTVGTTNGATLTVPVAVAKSAYSGIPASGSQSSRIETNRSSGAAASRR